MQQVEIRVHSQNSVSPDARLVYQAKRPAVSSPPLTLLSVRDDALKLLQSRHSKDINIP